MFVERCFCLITTIEPYTFAKKKKKNVHNDFVLLQQLHFFQRLTVRTERFRLFQTVSSALWETYWRRRKEEEKKSKIDGYYDTPLTVHRCGVGNKTF